MQTIVEKKKEDLIKLCILGNSLSQYEFYDKYSPLLFSISLRFAKNSSDAEDILQEAFIKIFRYLKDFRSEGSIEGWMRRIVVTTSYNFYKRKSLINNEVEPEHIKVPISSEHDIVSNMSHAELLQIVDDLPNGYKSVFNMNTFEGYSHKEIGDLMNISVNTSKSQLSRAKSSLQKKILSLFQAEEQKINLSVIAC